jgi:hypothetical protein
MGRKYHRAEVNNEYYGGIFNIFLEHNNTGTSEFVAVNYKISSPLIGSVSQSEFEASTPQVSFT